MRRFIKYLFITSFAIWATVKFVTGLSYGNDIKILVFSAFAFSLLNVFVKPLLKIIMLPINFVTLGIFSWITHVIMLYLTVVLISGFSINSFTFSGINYNGFIVPSYYLSTFWAAVLASFSISVISNILGWMLD